MAARRITPGRAQERSSEQADGQDPSDGRSDPEGVAPRRATTYNAGRGRPMLSVERKASRTTGSSPPIILSAPSADVDSSRGRVTSVKEGDRRSFSYVLTLLGGRA